VAGGGGVRVQHGGGIPFVTIINLSLRDGKRTNPCIRAAGVRAVPMSARMVQPFASQETNGGVNPLMPAMGPNVAGVIGSGVAPGPGGSEILPMGSLLSEPNRAAIGCALGATASGLVYMMAAGAPLQYLVINGGAFLLGLGLAGLMSAFGRAATHEKGVGTLALGVLLLGSSLFGVTVNGATRWITLPGFSLQPSLLVIPMMVVRFAGSRDFFSAGGLAIAGVALAVQPDRGMAGALLAALIALAALRFEVSVLIALAAAIAGFVATLVQIDVQPAQPFVEQIFFSAFEVHPLVGLAVIGGAALLLAPAFFGLRDAGTRPSHAAFGAIWLAVILAAVLGNYPTPVVGYGSSAIIGYLLSSASLPTVAPDPAVRRPEVLPALG